MICKYDDSIPKKALRCHGPGPLAAPRAARDAAKPPIQVTIDGAAAAGDFKIQSPDGRSLRWRLCDSDPQVPVQKFLLRTTLGR